MDSPKVAQQIETLRSPDPIMRRPGADREEKRVTHGATSSGERQEKLDLTDPNQRSLLVGSQPGCLKGVIGTGVAIVWSKVAPQRFQCVPLLIDFPHRAHTAPSEERDGGHQP